MSLPQLIVTYSSRTGKIPFSPFKRTQEDSVQQTKKEKIGNQVVKQSLSLKTDSLKVNVTGIDTVRPLANDSIQQVGDTSVAGMLRLFRFTDEENDELNNTDQPFISSSTYFKQHQLEVKSSSPQLFNKIAPDWFTVVLFFLIAGITTVKVFYQNIFRQLVEAVYSFAVTNQVVRDENLLVQRASVLLNVIFYCSSGLFFYWISVRYNWNHPFLNEGLLRFLFFAFVTAVFFTVKMLLLKLIGTVFNLDKPVAVFIFSIFLTNNLLGVLLVLITSFMAYLSGVSLINYIYLVIGILALAFIFLLYRAFLISRTVQGYSLYYLILYFCTLEIVPIVLIIKLASE